MFSYCLPSFILVDHCGFCVVSAMPSRGTTAVMSRNDVAGSVLLVLVIGDAD